MIVEYIVSDLSFALANATANSLPYLCAFPKVYELRRPLEEQGLSPCSFDMVVGLDIIHTAPEIELALELLHHVLIPGGCPIVAELDERHSLDRHGVRWILGIVRLRGRKAPSVSLSDGWERHAGSVGFVDFQHIAEVEGGLDFLFIAQESTTVESPFGLTIPTHHFFTYMFGKEMELQEEIKKFSVDKDISFWIPAAGGTDGDTTQGLIKSLSREYGNWNVHLGIFESNLTNRPGLTGCR